MLYETTAEYDAEIAKVRISLSRAFLVGLHSKNVTDGGTERTNSEVDVEKTQKYLAQLIFEKGLLGSTTSGMTLGAGW